MRWTSALSEKATLDAALDEVIAAVRAALGDAPDLLVVFTTMHHGLAWDALPARLRAAFPGARLVGACGGGVLAGGREREDTVALSLTAAVLPDVGLRTFTLGRDVAARRADPPTDEVAAAIQVDPDLAPSFLLLAEPFSCNVQGLARTLDGLYPHGTTVGAVASGAEEPGRHALFVDDAVVREGAVGVALWGNVTVDAVVAQGCRPVGPPMRITERVGTLMLELDGEPALDRLQATVEGLDDRTRRLFQVSPMVGVAIDPDARSGGGFLVRSLVGVDPQRKGIAVGHHLADGDIVQFQARDPGASVDDLHEALGRWAGANGAPDGALLFSCVGRGAGFYGAPEVESRTVRELLGDVPLGGFFSNAEVAPVHGRTLLHGFSSAVALFRAPQWN